MLAFVMKDDILRVLKLNYDKVCEQCSVVRGRAKNGFQMLQILDNTYSKV